MAVINLTPEQINFIQDNKGKMKQKEIAKILGVTCACVCKRIQRPKVIKGNFDINEFKKYYTA